MFEMRSTRVTPQEVSDLSRQLATFLRAGIPIIDAIDVMAEEAGAPRVQKLLADVALRLREGEAFSEAIMAHAAEMPTYYPGIVRSAELSGRLDVVLEQLAEYIDRDHQTRRKIKSALTYPGILGCMSVMVAVVMVGYVLPKFKGFFLELDAELPATTRLLLAVGDFTKKFGVFAFTGATVLALVLALAAQSRRGRITRDRMILRIPVMRSIVQAAVIERFCRILSAMVRGGVPIADGLNAAIESSNNRVYSEKLTIAAREMLEGNGFAGPIAATGLFPSMVTRMMRVGEDTGTLDSQLDVAASYYERELGFRLNKLTALFEPAIIVVMGLIVGFIAVALVQAMFGVYNQSGV